MKLTEGVQDFEFHCKGCEQCQAARVNKLSDRSYCHIGRQLKTRALASMYWRSKKQ